METPQAETQANAADHSNRLVFCVHDSIQYLVFVWAMIALKLMHW
jgi:hypothetical protein